MPRFTKLRDGHDWMWSDVMTAEEMISSFAATIERDCRSSAPAITADKILPLIKVSRYNEWHRLAGEVSRLDARVAGHYWVAERQES